MCLLSVWRSDCLPLDHQIPINSMICFHLKWYMDTNRFVQGTFVHPPDPNAFHTMYCFQISSYPKFSILADHLSRLDRPLNTEWSLDQAVANSIFQMLNFPQCEFVCDSIQLYVSPVPDNQALAIDTLSMNWNFLHAYAFPPTILIPSILAKIRQSRC